MAYSTPDVYITEETTLPPSVAEVSTAVPIFIGHTEWAVRGGDSLQGVPIRISSLQEYEQYFGGASLREYKVTVEKATVEHDKLPYSIRVESGDSPDKKHQLHYSLDHFFKNGGSDCYVLSIGTYLQEKTKKNFSDALKIVALEDEPTLIVLSEASSLANQEDYYDLCKEALEQCKNLMDRFCLIDIINNDANVFNDAEVFKNAIGTGTEILKYGAAYYPFLKTSISYRYQDAGVVVIDATASGLKTITTGPAGTNSVANAGGVSGLLADGGQVQQASTRVRAVPEFGIDVALLTITVEKGTSVKAVVDEWKNYTTSIDKKGFDLDVEAGNNEPLGALESEALPKGQAKTVAGGLKVINTAKAAKVTVVVTVPDTTASDATTETIITGNPISGPTPPSNTPPRADLAGGQITLDGIKDTKSALYSAIKQRLSQETVTLPPSPAVAGVYAKVDRERGVWKAPANVSLNAVVGPVQKIDAGQQARLNIDANSGKSINAIRSFTGKGTLIWGARTLAGNDNEWRYISVRRLFNMVEESAKKATFFAVFEPNDASTWLKVRGMIESYLYTLWQQGALAGASPKAAYYVRVGLGTTMTADDVNNGRMLIQIGLAAVRPAEFIVLTFSHKLQEA